MKDGVIADFEITEAMLRYFIARVHDRKRMVRPRIVIAVPSGITESRSAPCASRRCRRAHARCISSTSPWRPRSVPACPVTEPTGNMIIDIGGGTTEVAVISLSGIVYSNVDPRRRRQDGRGDHQLRQAQVQPADRRAHRRAHQGHHRDGLSRTGGERESMEVKGRDLVAGVPEDPGDQVGRGAGRPWRSPSTRWSRRAKIALERTPPELAADIVDKGIVLVGGGSLLTQSGRSAPGGDGPPGHVGRGSPHRCRHWYRTDARRAAASQGSRNPLLSRPARRGAMTEFRSRVLIAFLLTGLVAVRPREHGGRPPCAR